MKKTVKLLEESDDGIFCGCVAVDGQLHAGYVADKLFDLSLNKGEKAQKFFCTANNLMVVQTDKGTVHYGNRSGLKNSGKQFHTDAVFVAYGEGNAQKGALACENGNVHLITAGGINKLSSTFAASCAVLHCGRVFYVDSEDGYRICWTASGATDTTRKLNGAGYCYLQDTSKGEAVALMVYDGDVLVVRKYGFTKLHALGYAENFSVENTDVSTAQILPQTLALVNGDVYFYAEDGLYFYDGTDLEQCAVWEASDITPVSACGVGNWYFVCGDIPRLGGRGICCVDVVNKRCCYVRLEADLLTANERAYAVANGQCYELQMALSNSDWTSGQMDFGSAKRKMLRCIELPVCADADLTVMSEHGARSLSHASGRVSVAMSGKVFQVHIEGNCDVTKVRAEVIW